MGNITSIPTWLTKHYTLVHKTIADHYEEEKKRFNVKRDSAFYNEEEGWHISELRRLIKRGICHSDWKTSNATMSHEMWLLDFWKRYGLPELVIENCDLYGQRDVFGDIVLKPVYDEIKLNYSSPIGLFCQCDYIVRKGDMWGVIWKDGSIRVPFEYEDIFQYGVECFVVRKEGKYGIIRENRSKIKTLVGCRMDAIMYHDVMESLIVFKKDNKYGWCGCQLHENNSCAIWDEVYMPNEEYFYSIAYGEDDETFVAVKDKQYYDIEYWTSK